VRSVGLALAASVWIFAYLWNHLDHSYGFGEGAFGFLMLVAIAGTALLASLVAVLRGRRGGWVIAAVCLLIPIVAVTVGNSISDRQEAESFATGDQIVLAAREYQRDRGFYPEALAELAPQYLGQIPETASGMFRRLPFNYRQDATGDDFTLSFDRPAWFVCSRSTTQAWECHD